MAKPNKAHRERKIKSQKARGVYKGKK